MSKQSAPQPSAVQNNSIGELRQQRRDLLHELTRQAEIRKQEVRQLLKQSAESRGKESSDLRTCRLEMLKQISAEVLLQRADARIAAESPRPKKIAASLPAPEQSSIAVRRWTPGQWKPSRSKVSQDKITLSSAALSSASASPASASPASASPSSPVPASPVPASPVPANPATRSAPPTQAAAVSKTPAPDPPPISSLANAQLDNRLLALEERYSRLISAVQDQFDLTSRIEALTSRLDREIPERLDRKLAAESESLSRTLASQWQADLSVALAQAPASNTDISDTEGLVEKFAAEFQSFATEFTTRLASFEAQTEAYQMLQSRVDRLEVMRSETDADLKGTRTEASALQARLGRIESGLVSAINLLRHSGSPAVVEEMQARMEKIEAGLTVLIESLQKQPTSLAAVNHQDPSADQSLSSLSRLISGLRQAQAERRSEVHSVPERT